MNQKTIALGGAIKIGDTVYLPARVTGVWKDSTLIVVEQYGRGILTNPQGPLFPPHISQIDPIRTAQYREEVYVVQDRP